MLQFAILISIVWANCFRPSSVGVPTLKQVSKPISELYKLSQEHESLSVFQSTTSRPDTPIVLLGYRGIQSRNWQDQDFGGLEVTSGHYGRQVYLTSNMKMAATYAKHKGQGYDVDTMCYAFIELSFLDKHNDVLTLSKSFTCLSPKYVKRLITVCEAFPERPSQMDVQQWEQYIDDYKLQSPIYSLFQIAPITRLKKFKFVEL